MNFPENLNMLLENAWHKDTAINSIERWQKICEKEKWINTQDNLDVFIRIFGASWYFTRFVFVQGHNAFNLIDSNNLPDFTKGYFDNYLTAALISDDAEENINELRSLKNANMLQILVAILKEKITVEQAEKALTSLAESTLSILFKIFIRKENISTFPVTVLGMGRMAGSEMTFGSDLDLIFLYETDNKDVFEKMGQTIRQLLRNIAQPAFTGILYEVDMRLRPHGNSGPLVTAYDTFIEYHKSERDIWERQMMTRCRPILIMSDNVERVMDHVKSSIYKIYDTEELAKNIVHMRYRVQNELGSPKGKFDIKRGVGGIMDIDFITHYFQLNYGYKYPSLQTESTRSAIRELAILELISTKYSCKLIDAYNYLKRVEMWLRLFDLKSIDSFSNSVDANHGLSRAMGHKENVIGFYQEYISVTTDVRKIFRELLGEF
jgi:[glutamine synthetase] adenylyltransferase / [glutamine synthetase]-adenylyl-L-tyrosine phosphorylase